MSNNTDFELHYLLLNKKIPIIHTKFYFIGKYSSIAGIKSLAIPRR